MGDGMQKGIRVYGIPLGAEMINRVALFPQSQKLPHPLPPTPSSSNKMIHFLEEGYEC
jgi:hypothetical protein